MYKPGRIINRDFAGWMARGWEGGPVTVMYSSASGKNRSLMLVVSAGKNASNFYTNVTLGNPTSFSLDFSWDMTSLRSSRLYRKIAHACSSRRKA